MEVDNTPMAAEAVAIFKTVGALEDTIDELMSSGFDRADLSVLAPQKEVEARYGHSYPPVARLEDDALAPRTFYVAQESIGEAEGALVGGLFYVAALVAAGAIFAANGTLDAAIKGALVAGGAGGLIGLAFARYVGRRHTSYLRGQLDHGGILLWVRTRQLRDVKRAVEIFVKHSGRDVHVHALPTAS
ncbi:MAG TPA: hypothetical protein VL996_07005 [Methylocella sp.]|nr:hypothetical protein [Methylocella sp.]